MNRMVSILVSILALTASMQSASGQTASNMSFFITSAGPGNGADLGGRCQSNAYDLQRALGQGFQAASCRHSAKAAERFCLKMSRR